MEPEPDRVVFTAAAERDFAALVDFLDARNPPAARAFTARLNRTLGALAWPEPRLDGACVAMADGRPCRRFVEPPVVVLYDRSPGVLEVLRVYHHAREPITRG